MKVSSSQIEVLFWSCYRLVGDNIDLYTQAKIQSATHNNCSINWTQQYAILNRVNELTLDAKSPLKHLKHMESIEMLPDKKVQENLKMR